MLNVPFFITLMIMLNVITPSPQLIVGMLAWLLGDVLITLYRDK